MPADYTGDPTLAAPPDAVPTPETAPVTRHPVDGEALVAASVLQPGEGLANQVAWLKAPFAKALSWAGDVWAARNARGHRGAGFDHQGMPAGRFMQWQELWVDKDAVDIFIAPATGNWFGAWKFRTIATTPAIDAKLNADGPWLADLTTHPFGSLVSVLAGRDAAGAPPPAQVAATVIETVKPLILMPNAFVSMEADFSINPSATFPAGGDTGPMTYAWGFGDGSLVAGNSSDAINTGAVSPVGAYFCREFGGSVWRCTSRVSGGGTITNSTSVASVDNVPHRGRIEVIGAGSADDGVTQVKFYLDGVLVDTHAHSLIGAALSPFLRTSASNCPSSVLNVGPLRVTGRLAIGDQPIT